jgi:ribonuclease HI
VSSKAWKLTGWRKTIKDAFTGDVVALFIHMQSALSATDFEAFVAVAWSCWNGRNDEVFARRRVPPTEVVNRALHYIEEFRLANSSGVPARTGQRGHRRWPPPPIGATAVNVDRALSRASDYCGSGGVLRNSEGRVLGSFIAPLRQPLSPLLAELMAIIEGMKVAIEMGLGLIRVLSDCETAVLLIKGSHRSMKEEGLLVQEANRLANYFVAVEYVFVSRDCNSIAHFLAKKSLLFVDRVVWEEAVPPDLIDLCLAEMP